MNTDTLPIIYIEKIKAVDLELKSAEREFELEKKDMEAKIKAAEDMLGYKVANFKQQALYLERNSRYLEVENLFLRGLLSIPTGIGKMIFSGCNSLYLYRTLI